MEITPIGIENLQWKFYIIWTIFNAAFVPIVYFFYPETANRSLEDLDRYFTENKNILVYRDKVATSSKRPQEFMIREVQEVRRNSSVRSIDLSPAAKRHLSVMLDRINAGSIDDTDGMEKGVAVDHEKEKPQEEIETANGSE